MNPDDRTKPDEPMEPDSYQQAWRAQSSQTRVTVDADSLLKAVQENQLSLRAANILRDCVEIGTSLLMLPYWFYMGAKISGYWTWYLMVPVFIWSIVLTVVVRVRQRRKPSEVGEPLLASAKESLALVEHQIWWSRKNFWWAQLPAVIAMLSFVVSVGWSAMAPSDNWLDTLGQAFLFVLFTGFVSLIIFAVYGSSYFLNQRVVRTTYEPQRQELLALLANLTDETTGEVSGEYPVLMGAKKTCKTSPRRMFISGLITMVLLVIAVVSGVFLFTFISNLAQPSSPVHSNYDGPSRSSGPAGDSLAKLITARRKEKNLVGLAAMVMVDGQVEAAAAQGERKIASGVPLEIGDRWHLGGITKSITATMIARLIESGQMQWSDTVGKIFPEASVHQDWKPVTLRQLLTDTAGAPANLPREVRRKRPALGRECTQARREAVLNVIADKPTYSPGTKYEYSNVGYTIAGAMAEKVTGATWDDLMKREVFEPLKLTEAGFGPPKSADETLEQPRGHRKVPAGKIPMNDKSDNTPIIGPAATIHMTLQNLCNFAREHMLGQLGTGKLLSAETYKRLHTPELSGYACGWLKKEPSAEIPYTVYWHNGSNTEWYALVVFIPEKNKVIAVTSNDGDFEKAEAAAWEIVKASVKEIKAEAEPPRLRSDVLQRSSDKNTTAEGVP